MTCVQSTAQYRGLNFGGLNWVNEGNSYSEVLVLLITSAKIKEKRNICFPFRHAFSDSAYFTFIGVSLFCVQGL